jgi:hypothetical protein
MRWVVPGAIVPAVLRAAYAGVRAVQHGLEGKHGSYSDPRGATVLRYTLRSSRLDRELHEVGVDPAGAHFGRGARRAAAHLAPRLARRPRRRVWTALMRDHLRFYSDALFACR